MALTDFAFIVFGDDYGLEARTDLPAAGATRTRIVGVDSLETAEAVAQELVADGVQLIELCGWFGPIGAARIIEAVGGQIPVGFVTHGADSIDSMYQLFKSE